MVGLFGGWRIGIGDLGVRWSPIGSGDEIEVVSRESGRASMSEVSSLLTQSIDTERNAFHLFSYREVGDADATADVGLGAGVVISRVRSGSRVCQS
jgi:hypothetical protein